MNESLPLSEIHQVVFEFLRGRTDVALFGAQAVNAYVDEYRMTQDVDLMTTAGQELANVICAHLHLVLHIAVRTRQVAHGCGFRVYQLQKNKNRHLVDIRQVTQLPKCQINDGIAVVEPAELIALKVISMVSRRNTPKGMTDQADMMRLLIAFPEYKTEQGDVMESLKRLQPDSKTLEAWCNFVAQNFNPNDDDEY